MLGIKPLGRQSIKITWTCSKILLVDQQGVIAAMVSGPLSSTLDSWTHVSQLWENQCCILNADLEHIQPPGEHHASASRYCHLADTTILPSKVHFSEVSCFRITGNME